MRAFQLTVVALLTIAQIAGCPVAPAASDTAASTSQPVTAIHGKRDPVRYWVQDEGTYLRVYRLPAERGEATSWFTLDSGAEWFSGDGLYEFSGEYQWQRIDDGGMTFDDVLQTLDAAPAA